MNKKRLKYLKFTFLNKDEKYLMSTLLKQYRNFDSDACSLLKCLGELPFDDFVITIRPYQLYIGGEKMNTVCIGKLLVSVIHSQKILPEEVSLLYIIQKHYLFMSYHLPPIIWSKITYKIYALLGPDRTI